MKIFLLVSGWAFSIAVLLGLAMSLAIACCDPREKVDRVKQPWASKRNKEEDYVMLKEDEDGHRAEETSS